MGSDVADCRAGAKTMGRVDMLRNERRQSSQRVEDATLELMRCRGQANEVKAQSQVASFDSTARSSRDVADSNSPPSPLRSDRGGRFCRLLQLRKSSARYYKAPRTLPCSLILYYRSCRRAAPQLTSRQRALLLPTHVDDATTPSHPTAAQPSSHTTTT